MPHSRHTNDTFERLRRKLDQNNAEILRALQELKFEHEGRRFHNGEAIAREVRKH